MPLTDKQKAQLEAKKAQIGKKQQEHNKAFKIAMQANDQIHQYNQNLSDSVDKAQDTKLAGKSSEIHTGENEAI